jgi:predicted nucleotidyltransferase/ADP-ribose pyrophosphatase YjhB (NUDIX family)
MNGPLADAGRSPSTDQVAQTLGSLAQRLLAAYVVHCAPRAVLLTGSAGEGLADEYSDLDVIAYYEGATADPALLEAVRAKVGGENCREVFPRDDHACAEAYRLRGVDIEVAHFEITENERRLSEFLDGHDPGSTQHKAVIGILHGRPLHGADLIEACQRRCAHMPDALARAMVEHYLRQTNGAVVFRRRDRGPRRHPLGPTDARHRRSQYAGRPGRARVAAKVEYAPLAFTVLLKEFTMRDLRRAHEILTGQPYVHQTDFWRRMSTRWQLEETGQFTRGRGRPAALYRRPAASAAPR